MEASKLSAKGFAIAYAARSGVTVEWLMQYKKVVPCDCDDELCEGWQMIPRDDIDYSAIEEG